MANYPTVLKQPTPSRGLEKKAKERIKFMGSYMQTPKGKWKTKSHKGRLEEWISGKFK